MGSTIVWLLVEGQLLEFVVESTGGYVLSLVVALAALLCSSSGNSSRGSIRNIGRLLGGSGSVGSRS